MKTRNALLSALGAGLLIAVATPLAAAAHVTITPDTAEPGGYTTITVRVPNESETASTTRVDLHLPSETPLSSVRYVPLPGWTVEAERERFDPPVEVGDVEIAEAVTRISWSAEPGSEIADGEFQQFTVSLGPIPDVESLVLIADQHYSDGSVVSWSEEGENAERPAPVLAVNSAAPSGHHGAEADAGASGAGTDVPAPSSDTTPTAPPDVLARVLGVAGLVVGAVGVAFGVAAHRKPAPR